MTRQQHIVGVIVICNGVKGIIVENTKLPGDICIQWDTGLFSSYDMEWLENNVTLIEDL